MTVTYSTATGWPANHWQTLGTFDLRLECILGTSHTVGERHVCIYTHSVSSLSGKAMQVLLCLLTSNYLPPLPTLSPSPFYPFPFLPYPIPTFPFLPYPFLTTSLRSLSLFSLFPFFGLLPPIYLCSLSLSQHSPFLCLLIHKILFYFQH